MIWLAAWEACVEEPPCARMLAAAFAAASSVALPLRPVPWKSNEAWLPVPVSVPVRKEPAAETRQLQTTQKPGSPRTGRTTPNSRQAAPADK